MKPTSRRQFMKQSSATAAAVGILGLSGRQSAAEELASVVPPPRFSANHDLHTHTTYSDGAHPVSLHILEARAFELDALAITDHYEPGFKLHDSEEEFDRYLDDIRQHRAGQDDVLVLSGVEAAALDAQGRISIDQRHADRVDWVLCHLGGQSEATLRKTPQDKRKYIDNVVSAYMGLCDVPYLDAIAHPFNTGNTDPAAFPEDYPQRLLRELAAKMADKGKVFDLMNDMVYWFHRTTIAPRALTAQYVELVRLFASEGVRFQVSSDDHRTGVGNTRWAQIVLARAAVPVQQVLDPRTIRQV